MSNNNNVNNKTSNTRNPYYCATSDNSNGTQMQGTNTAANHTAAFRLGQHNPFILHQDTAHNFDHASSGASNNDSAFLQESVETMVALQERRRELEHAMMSFPGHQLGHHTFNLLQHPIAAGVGLASLGAHNAFSSSNNHPNQFAQYLAQQQVVANQRKTHELAAMRSAALARTGILPQTLVPSYHMFRQQHGMQHLPGSLIHETSSGPGANGSEHLVTNNGKHRLHSYRALMSTLVSRLICLFSQGVNLFQNVSSNGSSPPSNSPNTQNASDLPAVQPILVRDKLRYFNNGVEVEASGKPLPATTSDSVDDEVKAYAEGNQELTEFINLLLSAVPEIKHILARFLSSLNKMPHTQESNKQKLALVICMALEELNSIDKDVLDSIDPQCSDLASRVVRCIYGTFLSRRTLATYYQFNLFSMVFDAYIDRDRKLQEGA